MRLFLIFAFIVNFCAVSFGQADNTWSILHKSKGSQFVKDVQIIENKETGKFFTFIRERSHTFLYVLNPDKSVHKRLEISNKNFSNVNLQGVIFNEDNVHIVSNIHGKYYFYSVNLNSGHVAYKPLLFKSKKENNISIVNYENKIYIANAVRKGGLIRLYVLDETGEFSTIDHKFNEDKFMFNGLFYSLTRNAKSTIEANLPVNITSTQHAVKIYLRDQLLNVTIDHDEKTYLAQLDLIKETSHFMVHNANIGKRGRLAYVRNNSFILNDYLLQTINTNKGIDIYVKDLMTGDLKRSFEINRDEDIPFKNSDIVLEKGTKSKRTLTKTNQFIRKANSVNGQLAISAFESDGKIQMILGGVNLEAVMSPSGVVLGAVGGVLAATVMSFQNPIFVMYYNYQYKVTSIKCLFDENFNSIDGEIQENVFDRIKKDDTSTKEVVGRTLISSNGSILVGKYNENKDTYHLKEYKIDKVKRNTEVN